MRDLFRLCLLLTVAALLPATPRAAAQEAQVRLYAGLETHRLDEVRDWQHQQQTAMGATGIPLEVVEAFPPYLGVRAEGVLALSPARRLGVTAGYGSSGGRLHYADYSGEAAIDHLAERRHVGLLLEQQAPGPLPLWLNLHVRYSFTTIRSQGMVRLGTVVQETSETLKGGGVSLEPALACELRRGPVTARLSASLEYAFGRSLLPARLSNTLYTGGYETTLHAEWTGLRLGLTLGFTAGRGAHVRPAAP